jgi:hypothetical protein
MDQNMITNIYDKGGCCLLFVEMMMMSAMYYIDQHVYSCIVMVLSQWNKTVSRYCRNTVIFQTETLLHPLFSSAPSVLYRRSTLKKKWYGQFFLAEGVISHIFFRYMHKDKFLCIFSQIKNNAYLPVHLVHAPIFLWSPSYSFTFSFLCFLSV